jgi:hypothetical protein
MMTFSQKNNLVHSAILSEKVVIVKGKAPLVPFNGITSPYKKFDFMHPFSKATKFFTIMFCFGSAELKTKSLFFVWSPSWLYASSVKNKTKRKVC